MARVRRGVTTLTTDYRTAIPSAGKAGVDFVELGMEGPHRRERVRAEASEIRALADVYGVGLVVHLPYRLDLASPYEHVRRGAHEECEAALEAATTVDARRAVLHARTDALRHTADSAALGDRFVESVLDLDSYADHCGIDLAVENVAGDVFSLPEGFLPVFERTEVSVRLDVVRAAAAGLTTPETTALLAERADRIRGVHFESQALPAGEAGTVDAPQTDRSTVDDGGVDAQRVLSGLPEDWRGTVSVSVDRATGAENENRNGNGNEDENAPEPRFETGLERAVDRLDTLVEGV